MEKSAYTPVIEALERAPSIVIPLIREVPVAFRKRRPSPGKWSAHEHACHLAVVQPMFIERLGLMLAQEHPVIRPYVPEREHAEDALLAVDLDEALERFQRERAAIVARLRRLEPQQWDRTAQHAEYARYTLFIMFRHAALHDMLHAYRIEECLLKKEWT